MHRVATTTTAAARRVGQRQFRTTAPKRFTENKKVDGLQGILEADNATFTTKVHHMTNLGLAVLAPTALVLSPSALNLPVDLALGVLFPIHAHIGMNGVISDYVPKNIRSMTRIVWLGASVVMFVGLLRLNVAGPGITETVKSVWREDPKKENKTKQ